MPDEITTTGASADRYFEVYSDKIGEWRWTKWSRRGNLPDEKVADSAEGYSSMAEATKAAWKDDKGLQVKVRRTKPLPS